MANSPNSCRQWQFTFQDRAISTKNCKPNCFEPTGAPCSNYKIINLKLSDEVTNNIEDIPPSVTEETDLKNPIRTVDISSLPTTFNVREHRCCNLCEAQNFSNKNNLCSANCRPLTTSLHLEEWTKRPRPKPVYKHNVVLGRNTMVGRVFPAMLRISRQRNHCLNCGRGLYYRDAVADNSSVVVLSDCCDVKVYSQKYIENWHRVPILTLNKDERKRRVIEEVCQMAGSGNEGKGRSCI